MASTSANNPRRLSAYAVYASNNKRLRSSNTADSTPVSKKKKFDLEVDTEKETVLAVVNGGKAKRGRKKKVLQERKSNTPAFTRGNEAAVDEGERESESNDHDASTLNGTNEIKYIPCGNEVAEEAFKWLMSPVKPEVFFEKKFDKKPIHVQRTSPFFYKGLFTSEEFDKIMKENSLDYEKEIDVVSYVNKERITVTNAMKVHPSFVWKAYQEGNSIRMRNPQVYHKPLWKLCSLLQEYFSCFVGVNMYLTPAGSQGFPPHYDDIDAFILQIEGTKCWKLYKPRNDNEMLARYSSGDLKEDEIGEPYMEIDLKPGDMLYFPRGFIHQAMTTEDVHSLHLTFSCNQLNTWGDLLQVGLPHALEQAIKNNIEFRKSLPKDYLNHVGVSYSDCESTERSLFEERYKQLAQEVLKYLSVDHAADVHATDFIHGSMPPCFTHIEEACSIHGNGSRLENGDVVVGSNLTSESKIRFVRKRSFRKSHKEDEALYVEMDIDVVPAINQLFQAHPNFIKVEDLRMDCMDSKLGLAQQLYDNGFLMTEEPLPYEA